MMDDNKLTTLTHHVDKMLTDLLSVSDVGILPLSAIIIARIVLANDEVALSNEIRDLLIEAAGYPPKKDIVVQ